MKLLDDKGTVQEVASLSIQCCLIACSTTLVAVLQPTGDREQDMITLLKKVLRMPG